MMYCNDRTNVFFNHLFIQVKKFYLNEITYWMIFYNISM